MKDKQSIANTDLQQNLIQMMLGSNNVAEYTGIIKALEWMLLNKIGEDKEMIIVRGDSQLVVNQIKGKWKVRAPRIVPLRQRVMSFISKFKAIDIEWVPREQNKEADRLSNKAYQEAIDNNLALRKKIRNIWLQKDS